MNNYQKIKNMSITEMAESMIDRIDMYCESDIQMWIGDFTGIAASKEEALEMETQWLAGEAV